MRPQIRNVQKILVPIGTIITWSALIGQCYLSIHNRAHPILETLITFFSYLTIQVNGMVALCFSFLWLGSSTKWGNFFSTPSVIGAITLYIGVVGLIYNTLLRFLWNPSGLQFIVDAELHVITPLLFILYWAYCVPKETIKWGNILLWLLYPAAYGIYILSRGALFGMYPYPFLNVAVLGYQKVIMNLGWIAVLFILLSFLITGIAKMETRKSSPGT